MLSEIVCFYFLVLIRFGVILFVSLYIVDITEIREGSLSYEFECCKDRDPRNEDCYLAVVGSECTICLEATSAESRDWFLERLRLLADDMMSKSEIEARTFRMSQIRSKQIKIYSDYTEDEIESNNQLKELLLRGIQVCVL